MLESSVVIFQEFPKWSEVQEDLSPSLSPTHSSLELTPSSSKSCPNKIKRLSEIYTSCNFLATEPKFWRSSKGESVDKSNGWGNSHDGKEQDLEACWSA